MFEQYKEFVLQKAAPEREITNYHLLHAALGLSTETLELLLAKNSENINEELGDICWYLTLASHSINHTPIYWDTEIPCLILDFISEVEDFVSLVKKEVIYGNHQSLEPTLSRVWRRYQQMLYHFTGSSSPDTIMKYNMGKLNQRYSTTFTSEEAAFRKDKE